MLLFVLREADGIFRRMLLPPSPSPADANLGASEGGPDHEEGDRKGAGKGGKGKKGKEGGKQQQAQKQQQQRGEERRALDTTADVLKCPRWKKVAVLVKSYLGNSLHLLGASAEPAMLAFVLRRLRASAAFLGPFAKIQRRTLRAALGIFGSADNAPRVQVGGLGGSDDEGGRCFGGQGESRGHWWGS